MTHPKLESKLDYMLIGVAGSNGAGKDSVCEMLSDEFGFYFASTSETLREHLRAQGLETSRKNLSALSTKWRRESGLGALIDKGVEEYIAKGGPDKYPGGLVSSSLRNPGECQRVQELGGFNIWIDAEIKLRWERVVSSDRGRSIEDKKTYQEFKADEDREMRAAIDDPAVLSIEACKPYAKYTIRNDGTVSQLRAKIRQMLETERARD